MTHLERIVALAVEADMPTPVADALSDVLRGTPAAPPPLNSSRRGLCRSDLNSPNRRSPPALRPHALLEALQPLPQVRRLLSTREQQDAHELFVVLAEAVSDEALKVAAEVVKLRGIAEVLSLQAYCSNKGESSAVARALRDGGKGKRVKMKGLAQPWEGLMARRRVCRKCAWSEAVRMDTLGGMELPLPLHVSWQSPLSSVLRLKWSQGDTTLDACIAEYLAPELLTGVTCEMCSLRQTLESYRSDGMRLSLPPSQVHLNANQSRTTSGSFSALEDLPSADASGAMTDKRKKKARDARRVEARLQEMVESNTVTGFGEASLVLGPSGSTQLPVKWQKVNTDSIRESLITRVPQTLRLHCNRSGITPYGALVKKTARVAFPLILDMTRFISRGVWEERSNVRSLLANGVKGSKASPRVLYSLESAILHYGYTHSSGHFVCIRRKPQREGNRYRPSTIRKSCPDGCTCESCMHSGQVREPSVPGRGWLSVSDADVEEVGEEALVEARGAVFMLFYERLGEYDGPLREEGVEQGHKECEAYQTSQVKRGDGFG